MRLQLAAVGHSNAEVRTQSVVPAAGWRSCVMSWRLHATLTIVCGTCPVAMWCRSSKAVVAAHGQCVRSVSYNPNKPRYGGNAFFVARVCILGPFGAARLAHKSSQVAVTVVKQGGVSPGTIGVMPRPQPCQCCRVCACGPGLLRAVATMAW